ncbi:MAG: 2,3-bisphosphoglycerate-independent phosphoglycerate mutase [Alphaproteobacteria bacterium]|nr:2,3-bisphosphoglycerate-independent phosphoglycerate mutase [Alphaproteobacteria bacterium]
MIDSTADKPRPRPVLLCILDGWGDRPPAADNAIASATLPTYRRLLATCPVARLDASELEVGLPEGQMGNSEVGHMNIGAGRVVMQDLPRIDATLRDGSLARRGPLRDLIAKIKATGGTVHLMGLLSPGGVHSHQDHMAALVRAVAAEGIPVAVHAFLDGRDTPPRSAEGFLAKFSTDIAEAKGARLASLCGRYFAMDRDKRWERVEKAYAMLVRAEAPDFPDWRAALADAYAAKENDEFVAPRRIGGYAGMKDGDGLIMANFRADRAREILIALLDPAFDGFARKRLVTFAAALGMTEYSAALRERMTALFEPERLTRGLGELVAEAGLKQLRIAETEKYAHVTFFFNGGEERVFAGEDRILVPSPKVATYDLQPAMSAIEVTDRLVEAIASGRYDLIVVNYANGDMVGHTGVFAAAKAAAETIDACLGRLDAAIREAGGVMLITADHGNAEMMHDPATGQPHTAHTMNKVPAILVNSPAEMGLADGRLADIAPTLLRFLGLKQPAEMTGTALLRPTSRAARASA